MSENNVASKDQNIQKLLEHLDPEQLQAVTADPGPVAILAGAGTGKTRAVTHRIAWRVLRGDMRGSHITAVTFTARAAGEMRDRLRGLGVNGVNARTFHSAALRQLRYFGAKKFGHQLPDLIDSSLKFISIAAARAGVQTTRAKTLDLASDIDWAAANLIGPDDYVSAIAKLDRDPPMDAPTVAKVYAAYKEGKERAGVMDFSDVLSHTIDLIENDEYVADQIRSQYRFFVVDEYQDSTPLQQSLLDAWVGDRNDITVVGDASQTIYSFTGATSTHLMDFTRRWKEATLVRLVRDYRSTPQVVALANTVIAGASGREAQIRLELVGQREAGPEVRADVYNDEAEEADTVAKHIAALIAKGNTPSEIAILYRTNAQSAAYEEAMNSYGIPTVVKGSARFYDRPEIRQAMVALRSALNTDVGSLPLAEAVPLALEATGWRANNTPEGGGAQREQYEAVSALAALAEHYADHSLEQFCAELKRRASEQHAPAVQGVTLASLHSAKGLEWDSVFLVGLSEGTLPTSFARSPAALEEERRLLYVGITRARINLFLSYAKVRQEGGRNRKLCRFLAGADISGFPKAALKEAASVKKKEKRVSVVLECSGCSKTLSAAKERKLGHCDNCPATMDEELLERLTAWRLLIARQSQKPAFTVFTDVTLIAIAEQVPGSASQLSALHGIGQHKLDRYCEAVLCLVKGGTIEEAAECTNLDGK